MFSIIVPMDPDRLELFKETKRAYDSMPQTKEFLVLTRHEAEIRKYLADNNLSKDIRLIPYTVQAGFNSSKALNLGTKNAKYNSIIVTSPEVKPMTPVLEQLEQVTGTNVICRVWDEDEDKEIRRSLVRKGYRDKNPAFYFLAMFNKADIEKINGWDEDFMRGYAYEDNDFGARWSRANIPWSVRDDIQARHQYHPRKETISGGLATNRQKLDENNKAGIIRCKNGLVKLD